MKWNQTVSVWFVSFFSGLHPYLQIPKPSIGQYGLSPFWSLTALIRAINCNCIQFNISLCITQVVLKSFPICWSLCRRAEAAIRHTLPWFLCWMAWNSQSKSTNTAGEEEWMSLRPQGPATERRMEGMARGDTPSNSSASPLSLLCKDKVSPPHE